MDRETIEAWTRDIAFERQGPLRRTLKALLFNPIANYMPASVMRGALRFGKSELAAANWSDPGGWRSMVISYEGAGSQIADKILVGAGSMSMALRNRRRLGSRLITRLIERIDADPVEVLCLGAGPGQIIMPALEEAEAAAHATLVALSADAFEFGRTKAAEIGLTESVRFIQGDVRDVEDMLDRPPDIIKMLGICEYLDDEHIREIASSISEVCRAGTYVVFNSISRRHGSDRFFRRVLGLHMIHRTPEQLQEILGAAGFGEFVAIPEPLGVYHVIVGRMGPSGDVD